MTSQDPHSPSSGHDAPDPPDGRGEPSAHAVILAGRESGSVDISVEYPLVKPHPSPTRVVIPSARPDTPPMEVQSHLDAWVVPPHTSSRRTHGRGRDQKGQTMAQPLAELAEQFCLYQFKQRGRTKGGVEATRWVLSRFVKFVRAQTGRQARVTDLTVDMIQQWMDDMAANDLSLSTCAPDKRRSPVCARGW